MQKITTYKLTATEHKIFKDVADAIQDVCEQYDGECEKDSAKCPFVHFCPYACTNGEGNTFSDIIHSIPTLLEKIEIN